MNPELAALLDEDARREARLSTPYDPAVGLGSPLERVPIAVDPAGIILDEEGAPCAPSSVLIPVPFARALEADGTLALVDAAGGIVPAALAAKRDPVVAVKRFTTARLVYDYEFWAAVCARIQDKEGNLVPLVLNPPQRASLADRERARTAGKPVRQIELKHRQYGSSTEKLAYSYWLSNVVAPAEGRVANAYVVSLDQAGAADIASRYDRIADNYPAGLPGRASFSGVLGARNTRLVKLDGENAGTLYLGSSERPNAPSGRTVQIVLVSEAGKMASTAAKGASKLFTNLMSTVPMRPGTFVCAESTAEASGEWFARTWHRAENGKSAFQPTFIGWLTDPQYRLTLTDAERADVAASLGARGDEFDDHERELWERGAALSQIAWARQKRTEYDHLWEFLQEFPSSPGDAWAAGERRVFPAHYVQAARRHQRPPVARGELVLLEESAPGKLGAVRFEPNPRGRLLIWRWPGDTYGGQVETHRAGDLEIGPGGAPVSAHPDDVVLGVTQRYAAATDVGSRWEGGDNSITGILDRAPRLWGSRPEFAAEWAGHIDPDELAWLSARLCAWFASAGAGAPEGRPVATTVGLPLWAPEINRYVNRESQKEGEGWDGTTVVDRVRGAYSNVYVRTTIDSATGKHEDKLGWHMNKETKSDSYATLMAGLRAHVNDPAGLGDDDGNVTGYVEPCEDALAEMDGMLWVEGRMEARKGGKDDRVDVRAILAALDARMPEPVLVPVSSGKKRRRSPTRRGVSHATFG